MFSFSTSACFVSRRATLSIHCNPDVRVREPVLPDLGGLPFVVRLRFFVPAETRNAGPSFPPLFFAGRVQGCEGSTPNQRNTFVLAILISKSFKRTALLSALTKPPAAAPWVDVFQDPTKSERGELIAGLPVAKPGTEAFSESPALFQTCTQATFSIPLRTFGCYRFCTMQSFTTRKELRVLQHGHGKEGGCKPYSPLIRSRSKVVSWFRGVVEGSRVGHYYGRSTHTFFH